MTLGELLHNKTLLVIFYFLNIFSGWVFIENNMSRQYLPATPLPLKIKWSTRPLMRNFIVLRGHASKHQALGGKWKKIKF